MRTAQTNMLFDDDMNDPLEEEVDVDLGEEVEDVPVEEDLDDEDEGTDDDDI